MEPYFTTEQIRTLRLATTCAMLDTGASSREDRMLIAESVLGAFSYGVRDPVDLGRFVAKRFLGVRSGIVIDLASRRRPTPAAMRRA